MEPNIETKQQLEMLLAKPSLVTKTHIPFLQSLVNEYPYYQLLHLLLAKASANTEHEHSAFTKAALYNNGSILHRLVNEPQRIGANNELNIITYQAWTQQPPFSTDHEAALAVPGHEVEENPTATEQQVAEAPIIENLEPLPNEVIAAEMESPVREVAEKQLEEPQQDEEQQSQAFSNFEVPEIENIEPLQHEMIRVGEPDEAPAETAEKEALESDEQQTFEEIGEVVIPPDSFANPTLDVEPRTEQEQEEQLVEEVEEEVPAEEDRADCHELYEQPRPPAVENIEIADEGELDVEHVAAADFFAFERSFTAEPVNDEITSLPKAEEIEDQQAEEPQEVSQAQENIVSKYDDDKLPFTFLWWLAKTRKDHEQIFRPYASPVKAPAPAQDLQQQYVEHIFHLQGSLEPNDTDQAVTEQKTNKESEIIDNFIKNDPQIKAPKADQINNDNKAKRSAEDNYDLVSETLAQIYIEQMLYHKAIDTYQKLSLKFPEKSRYFADLIQSLEKKI